ncbi:MAG: hypothetical protein Kow0032_28710 [Methyloligellaceae bacterium]
MADHEKEWKRLLRKTRFREWTDTIAELSNLDRRINGVLISRFNWDKGCAWPSQDSIAKALGKDPLKDRRSIQRSIRRLAELEVWDITPGDGRGHATEYRPRFDRVPPDGDVYQAAQQERAAPTTPFNGEDSGVERASFLTERASFSSLKGGAHDAPTVLEPIYQNRSSTEASTEVEAHPAGGGFNHTLANLIEALAETMGTDADTIRDAAARRPALDRKLRAVTAGIRSGSIRDAETAADFLVNEFEIEMPEPDGETPQPADPTEKLGFQAGAQPESFEHRMAEAEKAAALWQAQQSGRAEVERRRQASERVHADLHRHLGEHYGEVVAALTADDDDAATAAEIEQPGSGWRLLAGRARGAA